MVLDIRIHAEDIEQLRAVLGHFFLAAAVADFIHDGDNLFRPVHVHVLAVSPFKELVIVHIHHLIHGHSTAAIVTCRKGNKL